MLYYSYLFIIGSAIVIFISKKIYGVVINPIFDAIGLLLIAFSIFYLADFIDHTLSEKTIFMYILGACSFLIGIVWSQLMKHKKIVFHKQSNQHDTIEDVKRKEYLAHYKIVKVGFFITSIVFVITAYWILFHVGISAFIDDIFRSVRDTMSGTPLFTFNEFLKKTLIIFSPMELLFAQKYKTKRLQCYFFVVLGLIVSLSFTRVMFLYLLIVDFLVFYFSQEKKIRKKKKNTKNKIIAFAIIMFAISFFNNTQETFNKVMNTTGTLAGYELSSSQLTIISYFFAPLKSTDMYVIMELNSLPLVATFRYIYEYIFHITTSTYVDVPFVQIPFSFNTAHGFYYLYREGGFLWLIILSIFFGFISDRIFMIYKRERNADSITAVCFLTLCLIMGIRSYMPMFLEFWIPLITMFYVRRTMQKARKGGKRVAFFARMLNRRFYRTGNRTLN